MASARPQRLASPTRARVRARATPDSSFDEFWKAWPNKVGKPAAQKAFRSAVALGGPSMPETRNTLEAILMQRQLR